jgi:hypothetical protein
LGDRHRLPLRIADILEPLTVAMVKRSAANGREGADATKSVGLDDCDRPVNSGRVGM